MELVAGVLGQYTTDWLDLCLRWLHVIAAIGWIGSSFYFVLLDQSLREPKDPADREAGVKGELWEVHGGGFYHVQKYQVVPKELPDHLAWFKWEAYTTWLSGFSLMIALYWLDARSYMIDTSVADIGPWTAVGISAGLLVVAWIAYDLLCRLIKDDRVLGIALALCIALAAWGTAQLYSPRAAWLQTGAMLGTIMAGSVLFNIIPAHWELIRAKEDGRDPDPAPGIEAKRRSVHNNYFTLPVLVTMLAGHFTFLTGHSNAWLILLALMATGAWIRHFYNLRHGGDTRWWMLGVVAVAAVTMFFVLKPDDGASNTSAGSAASAGDSERSAPEIEGTFQSSCGQCHTLSKARTSGNVGPGLDNLDMSYESVVAQIENGGGGMPPFKGKLTDDQIDALAKYVTTKDKD